MDALQLIPTAATYQIIGFASIPILYLLLVGLILIWRLPNRWHKTFSEHAATTRASSVYYFIVFAATFTINASVFAGYIAPKLHLSQMSVYCFNAAIVAQIICTIFPLRGATRRIHGAFASLSAILFVILTIIISLHSMPIILKYAGFISVATMVLVGVSGLLHKQFSLLYQAAFYSIFFIYYGILLAI